MGTDTLSMVTDITVAVGALIVLVGIIATLLYWLVLRPHWREEDSRPLFVKGGVVPAPIRGTDADARRLIHDYSRPRPGLVKAQVVSSIHSTTAFINSVMDDLDPLSSPEWYRYHVSLGRPTVRPILGEVASTPWALAAA